MEYKRYLLSSIWKSKRKEALTHCPQCVNCRSLVKLVVHHTKYPKVLGEEPLEDLQVLCSICHDKLHGMTKHMSKPLGRKLRYARKKNSYAISMSSPVKHLSREEINSYALQKGTT